MTETDLSLYFANPITPDHKRYEALRALLFEKLPKIEVIEKFGYTEYTLQALVRDFRQGKLIFFRPKKPGPKQVVPILVSSSHTLKKYTMIKA